MGRSEKSLKNMKFIASLLAAFAIANPVPADDPAPASSEGGMDTDIIMINMNMANIQMNMGDFRGSEYAADGFSYNNTMQFLSGINAADRDQIAELLAMPELQAGFQTLAENLPGFQSFVDTMLPADSTEAPTTTEAAAEPGMGR